MPGSVLEITGEAGNDPRSYRVDFSRARKELGFEAGWTIPDGAEQLATEYRARGLTQDAFDNTVHPAGRAVPPPAGRRAGRVDARAASLTHLPPPHKRTHPSALRSHRALLGALEQPYGSEVRSVAFQNCAMAPKCGGRVLSTGTVSCGWIVAGWTYRRHLV